MMCERGWGRSVLNDAGVKDCFSSLRQSIMVKLSLLLVHAALSTTTLPMAISASYDGNGGDVFDRAPGAGSRDKGVASRPMLRRPSSQLIPFIDPEERRDESIVEVSRAGGWVGVSSFIREKMIMFDHLSNLPPFFSFIPHSKRRSPLLLPPSSSELSVTRLATP